MGWLAHWDLLTFFTFTLAVATIWLAIATQLLRRDSAKSAEAAAVSAEAARQSIILSNRPKIIVCNVVTDRDDLLSDSHNSDGSSHLISGTVQLFNAGNTVAKVYTVTCDIWVFGNNLPMKFPQDTSSGEKRVEPKFELQPGVYATEPFSKKDKYGFNGAGNSHYIDLKNGAEHFYLIGEISYCDELKSQRTTRFGRRYDREKKRFFIVDDPDHESAN